jgi:transposase
MKFAEAPVPRDQINLIPTCLGDLIPDGHPIRLLDELLNQLDWSAFNEQFRYEKRGRPPIAPQILATIWIYAFFRRVKSSRQLEYQLNTNTEFMWLAHGHRIDHSTLAIFRKNNKQALSRIQKDLIRLVKDLGVVKIAELYVDGTRIAANSSRHRTMTAAKASKLLNIIRHEIDSYLDRVERTDQVDESGGDEISGELLPDHLDTLQKRKEQLEGILQQCQEMDAIRKQQGVNPEKNPFQLPVGDRDSRILPNKEGGYAPNYTPMTAVEGELGLIVSTIIINNVNEQDYLHAMVDDAEQSFGVVVDTVGADAAYSTGTNIDTFHGKKDFLSPHRKGDPTADNPALRDDLTQPVADADLDKIPTERGKFSAEAFVYDETQDVYHCPQGRTLQPVFQETRTQSGGQEVTRTVYQSSNCADCPLLSRCRVGSGHKNGRRISRDEHEAVRAAHREKMATEEAKQRYNKRFGFGERPFAQIKQRFGLRRFQTRGQDSVSSEFSLVTLAHNLLRLINYFGSVEKLRALATTRG